MSQEDLMNLRERRERVALEAAEWVLRMTSGEMDRSARLEYVAWLRESPLHVAEMLRVAGTHKRLAEFDGWSELPLADPAAFESQVYELPLAEAAAHSRQTELASSALARERRRGWRRVYALAAAVAVIVVTLAYVALAPSNTVVAVAGQLRRVSLPDGSIVELSPNTRLEVHFTSPERDVVLSRGDALFTVAKDAARPFIVETKQARVRAVGTVFAVQHDRGAVIVTVQEGRVAVLDNSREPAAPVLTPVPITEISLGANQQIVVPPVGPMGQVQAVDSQRALAWAHGRFVFDNTPVSEVVRRFNRYNRLQIQVSDPALEARPVSAVFDNTDPQAFVVFLESVANVRVTQASANQVVVTAEGPP
jgi:transmembrane sensor